MRPDGLSVETIIAERVVERMNIELGRIQATLDRLERLMPPQLGDVARAVQVTGLSPATIRRRMKDGTIPSRVVGSRRLVDLAALRPTEPEVVAQLAREARGR